MSAVESQLVAPRPSAFAIANAERDPSVTRPTTPSQRAPAPEPGLVGLDTSERHGRRQIAARLSVRA